MEVMFKKLQNTRFSSFKFRSYDTSNKTVITVCRLLLFFKVPLQKAYKTHILQKKFQKIAWKLN